MIKNIVKFEANIEGKIGHFLLDHDTSLNVAKEMAFQFLKYLGQLEDQAKAQQEQNKLQNESKLEANSPVESELSKEV